MSRALSICLAVGSVLAAAGLAFAATGRERHEAIYPSQKIPINFSHAKHLEEGADCVACHDGARKSVKASDVLTPRALPDSEGKLEHPECESCHDIEAAAEGKKVDPPAACETCHLGYDKAAPKNVARTSFPTANLIFNHKVHIDRKVECSTCHFSASTGNMNDVALSTRFQLPKMETCLTCHNGATAPAECKTCHLMEPSGRMQLTFASAALKPMQGDPFGMDHGPRFEFTHGTRAKVDRLSCSQCHAEKFCTTCHDSMQKPLSIHPNDYVTLHPIQAKMDSMNCQACHRYQSFCAACHERTGVGLNSDPSLRARNLSVHGDYAKWVQAGPDNHAVAASRDISTCAACHREETCLACHATQAKGLGSSTNPHGSGFVSNCKNMMAANSRACLKCHTLNDADLMKCH